MFKPKFTITNSIANTLTTIERARGFLEAATLSDEWVAKMQNKALILEAHHTRSRVNYYCRLTTIIFAGALPHENLNY